MYCIFSAADEEAFEDNSEEYIRRDLEGSGNPQIYTKNTLSLNIALKSILLRLLKHILELWKVVGFPLRYLIQFLIKFTVMMHPLQHLCALNNAFVVSFLNQIDVSCTACIFVSANIASISILGSSHGCVFSSYVCK